MRTLPLSKAMSVPASRTTDSRIPEYVPVLGECARRIFSMFATAEL
jgi:hypothetical protein